MNSENLVIRPFDNFVIVYLVAMESFTSFISPVQAATIRVKVGGGRMKTLDIKQQETRRPIEADCLHADGSPVDLAGATVLFTAVKQFDDSNTPVIQREAVITDAENGKINFFFEAGELTAVGKLKAEFEVTYPDGNTEIFPNRDYISINIQERLRKGEA